MKIEDQVCSLELSKRLKELGVKQESLYCWRTFKDGTSPVVELSNEQITYTRIPHDYEYYSAFTVAELGEMLPIRARSERWEKWYCTYNPHGSADADGARVESADTEADARAKCLIYLIENNLITL